jgi:L-malate glycosyltransferase
VKAPYHVMHVVHGLDVGGLELMLNRMVKRLDPARFRCTMCCYDMRGNLAEDFEQAGVPVYLHSRRPGVDYRYPFRLARLFRRERVDLAHLHTEMGFIYGTVAGLVAGTRAIMYTEHGRDFPASRRKTLANRVLAESSVHTVPVSAALRDDLIAHEHFAPSRMTVIHNGVPDPPRPNDHTVRRLRAELGASEHNILLGTVGRLKPVKDHAGLIRAMPQLLARRPQARLAIVGGGELHAALLEDIRRLNLDKHVVLAGERKEVAPYLHAFDIFVLSSLNEGMPLSLLEGLAAGKPAVSMKVGGVVEALSDGIDGFCAAPANYRQLMDRVVWLIDHPDERRAMGQRGREKYLANFTIERMVANYVGLYEKLLAHARTTAAAARPNHLDRCDTAGATTSPQCSRPAGQLSAAT